MTRHRYDKHSPVHKYLKHAPDHPGERPTDRYLQEPSDRSASLPTPALRVLTPEVVNTPQAMEYIACIATGDTRQLAVALVQGRLEHLQYRRDIVNFWRQFIGLSARPMPPDKQVADVMQQLAGLYTQATTMMTAKNALADACITQATKQGKLDLEKATFAAQIAEQERLKAVAEKATRDIQTPTVVPEPPLDEKAKAADEREMRRAEAQLRKDLAELARDEAKAAAETEKIRNPPGPARAPTQEEKDAAVVRAKDQKLARITKLRAAQERACAEALQSGHAPGTDHYERVFNLYDSEIQKVLLER